MECRRQNHLPWAAQPVYSPESAAGMIVATNWWALGVLHNFRHRRCCRAFATISVV